MKKMPAHLLHDLCEMLKSDNHYFGKSLPGIDASILYRGWLYRYELEDLLLAADYRTSSIDITALVQYFELPMRSVFKKPRFLSAGAILHEALALVDAAYLFIQLENMGFDSQPIRLVKPALDKLGELTHVTESEWIVLTYSRRRDKECFEVKSDAGLNGEEYKSTRKTDNKGRRFEFASFGPLPYSLKVKGPKYRAPVPRIKTTCETCGYSYIKGDPESALSHRSEHARIDRFFNPRPLPAFSSRLISHPDPELVTVYSPLWMHREIHTRARQFRHELQFDMIQWEGSSDSKNTCPESHSYLFDDHTLQHATGTVVGACAFWRDADQWRLRWVWVCPKMRRAGVLTHRWAQFIRLYGDFEIELPLSDAMHAFVLKHGTQKQIAVITAAPVELPDC